MSETKPSATSKLKYVKIGEASEILGVSIDTLRRWEKSGKIETIRTPGGTRLYKVKYLAKLHEKKQAKNLKSKSIEVASIPFTPSQTESIIPDIKEIPVAADNSLFSNPSEPIQTPFQNITPNVAVSSLPENKTSSQNFAEVLTDARELLSQNISNSIQNDQIISADLPNTVELPAVTSDYLGNGQDLNSTVLDENKSISFDTLSQNSTPLESSMESPVIETIDVAIEHEESPSTDYYSFTELSPKEQVLADDVVAHPFPAIDVTKASSYFPINVFHKKKIYAVLASVLLLFLFTFAGIEGFFQKNQPTFVSYFNDTELNNVTDTQSQVLAESTIALYNKYLEVNADVSITGNLAVEGQGIFNESITAPNIVYGLVAGTNITITGDPQNPVITATGGLVAEGDTLASVTARGAATTTLVQLNGGVSTTNLSLSNALSLGNLTDDPLNVSNGSLYYNTTSNKFRCYINGSWQDCDTDTDTDTINPGFSGISLVGDSGSEDIEDGDEITIAGGNGITTVASATDTLTVAVNAGNGLTFSGSSLVLNLNSTGGTSSTITSNSGLEVSSNGLSLIRGCDDDNILKWDAPTESWACAIDAGGSGSGVVVEENNSVIVSSGTILDFLGGDFDVSEGPIGEANIQLSATLTSVTGVAGSFSVAGALAISGNTTIGSDNSDTLTVNAVIQGASPFVFEGSTADGFETTFAITDPTADHIITFPNAAGEVSLLGQTIENGELANSTVTVNAGTGMSGGGSVALGGSVTLHNAGVTSAVAGTGIGVSGATGAVTISNTGVTSIAGTANQITASGATGAVTLSLPQDIATSSSVTFANVSLAAGGALRTGTSAGNTALLQAYDVDGAAFTTFGTLTAGNTPSFDLATSTTIGTQTILSSGNVATYATTGVTAGLGLTGGGTVGLLTLNIGSSSTITVNADDIAVASDSIGDTQLAFNTGQHLTTTSAVTFSTIDTGQGANELYDMDQNVLTTSNVTFANIIANGDTTIGSDNADSVTINAIVQGSAPLVFEGATANGFETTFAITDPTGARTITFQDNSGVVPLATNGNTIFFTTSGNTSLTLPTSGTVCTTDTCLTSGTFVDSLSGTANQVLVNGTSGTPTTGAITLTLPQDIATTSGVTFATLNTGQGNYELYAMNQDVETTDAVTFATIDTGQGANELYDMDQNVQTSDSVTFANVTLGNTGAFRTSTSSGNTALLQAYDVDAATYTTFATLTAGNTPTFDLNSATTIGTNVIVSSGNVATYATTGVTAGSGLTGGGTVGLLTLNIGSSSTITVNADDIAVTADSIGDTELAFNTGQHLTTTSAPTFATIDTGQGANELYDMDQNVLTTSAVTFLTIDTGQGANELYDMDQNVLTSSDVTFANLTLGTGGAVRTGTSNTNTALLQAYDVDGAAYTTFATLTAGNTPTFDLSSATTIGSATIVSSSNIATYATTAVTAGAGLTDGGTTGALTLNIGSSTTITVNADDIAVASDSIGDTQLAFNTGQHLTTTSAVTFSTIDTGQGANELYDMDQNVLTSSDVAFNSVTVANTGLHIFDTNASHDFIIAPGSDLSTDRTLTITTGDADRTLTLNGNATLDDWFDQSVKTTAGVTFATIDTGQGANELYDMDQNVLTSSDVTFSSLTANGNVTLGSDGSDTVTVNGIIQGSAPLIFEGSSADANELTFSITDPTGARTQTFQDNSGVIPLATSGNTVFFTTTGNTSLTLPTSGTVCTTDTCLTGGSAVASITGTANQVLANGTSGSAQTGAVTLTLPQDIGTSSNVTFGNLTLGTGGAVRTGTSNTNTALLQAYDVDGAAYTTFATLTAGNTPTFDLAAATTIGASVIVSSSNVGTYATTAVTAGAGLTGGGTTGALTLNIGSSSTITVNADDIAVASDSIGDTQLAFNTGQHLTTTSAPTFATIDTGQGANELYDMDQNVLTSSDVTFANVTLGNTGAFRTSTSSGNTALIQAYDVDGAAYTTFATLTAGNTPTFDLNSATTIGTNTIVSSDNVATYATTGVTAGSGLTGGGTVGVLTLNIGSSATITVNADDIAVTADSIGDTELAFNTGQHLTTTSAVTFSTIDTGQGANELYDMDQNVLTSSDVTFSSLTANGNVTLGSDGSDTVTVNGIIQGSAPLIFEGSSADANELTFSITDPTGARTQTFQDNSGVVALGTAGNTIFFTTTGNTNVTLPTSGTLCSTSTCEDAITFANGLTRTGDAVALGGPLTGNTTITQDGTETLTFSNTGSGELAFDLTSTGDLVIKDNGTNYFTFGDDRALTYDFNGTTADGFTINATSLTTGSGLVLNGPSGGTAGLTDALFKVTGDVGHTNLTSGLISFNATVDTTGVGEFGTNLSVMTTNANSTNPNTAIGIDSRISDATSLANTNLGINAVVTITGDAARESWGLAGAVNTTSNTADTAVGVAGSAAAGAAGTITSGTRNLTGVMSATIDEAVSTGGTTNLYGFRALMFGDSGSGSTYNAYHYYVQNGTFDTDGTTTQIGLALEPLSGADTNIGICFDCDGTWSSSTVAAGIQFGIDANSVNLYRNGSDLLQTDDTFVSANITSGATVSGANTGDQNLFSQIDVASHTSITANSTTTALTIEAGTGVSLATNNTTKTLTISATGTGGDITAVGSMTTGSVFADSTADGDWLGLGGSAGRIGFADLGTDEVEILDATLDLNTGLITNIGNSGTDFTTGGGLTLAGDFLAGQTTSKIGFGGAVSGSDYLMNITLDDTQDWSRGINITQANNSAEDSSMVALTNNLTSPSLTSGTRTFSSLDVTTAVTAASINQNSGTEVILNAYGISQNFSANNFGINDTIGSGAVTLNQFANYALMSGSTSIGDTSGGAAKTLNIASFYADNSAVVSINNDSSSSTINLFGGRFGTFNNTSNETSTTINSYGVYASAAGDLTTTGTTAHYGGYFAASNTADNNYGVYVASVSGGTNRYGLYINTVASGASNWSFFNNADAQSFLGTGNVGIGDDTTADATFEIEQDVAEQFRLGYDNTNYVSFAVSSGGDLTITPTGGSVVLPDSTLLDLSGINMSASTEGLILPQVGSACTNATAEGQICWDTAGEDLYVGNGSVAVQINGAGGGTGDIEAVGNITSGAAFTSGVPGAELYFADNGFLGLGSGAGRIGFADLGTDEVDILDATLDLNTGLITNIGNSGTDFTTGGGLTLAGAFDANGQFDLGDGGDAGTISSTTLDVDATGALQINSSGGAISIGNDAVNQNINIGTAGTRDITLANASANVLIGNGTPGMTLDGNDLYVTGASEFDGAMRVDNAISANSILTVASTLTANGDVAIGNAATDGLTITSEIRGGSPLVFEGSTNNDVYTTFSFTDPTGARTQTFQDNSGVVALGTAGNTLFFTTTGATNVTLPTSGTLCSTSTCEDAITFSNGLTRTGDAVALGGALTGNTTITQDGTESFTISNTGSGETAFDLTSTGDLNIKDNGTIFFSFNDNGTLGYTGGSSVDTETAFDLTANSLTSGTAFSITATALTTGSFFDINNGASIFNVSQNSFTTSLPVNFTSPGDVSIANDIQFTNPTASYIKSYSALTLMAGDSFGSSNLTLGTYNEGSVYIPTAVATGTGLDVDADSLTSGSAVDVSSTNVTSGTLLNLAQSASTFTGNLAAISLGNGSGTALNISNAGTGYGFRVNDDGTFTDSSPFVIEADGDVLLGGTSETLANTGFVMDGNELYVAGMGGFEGNVYTDGSFVAGASTTYGNGTISQSSGETLTIGTTSANLTLQTTTSGTLALTSAGALNLTAGSASTWSASLADSSILDLSAINASGTGEGLILPQNASACANATAEGQICWDTAGEDLYIGNGTTAVQMNAGGSGTITAVGNISSGEAFTSGTPGAELYFADNGFLGLGSGAGRIEFDNQATDEINFIDANVGIGTSTPASPLHVMGLVTLGNSDNASVGSIEQITDSFGSSFMRFNSNASNGGLSFEFRDGGNAVFRLYDSSEKTMSVYGLRTEGSIEVDWFDQNENSTYLELKSEYSTNQTTALTGAVIDLSTNWTVPDSSSGNQTGIALTMANGGTSATSIGLSIAGAYDTGISFAGTPGTNLIDSSTIDITAAGAVTGVTGITYASGAYNFDQSASSGTFATGTGAVSLNGDTTVANGKNFVAGQTTGKIGFGGAVSGSDYLMNITLDDTQDWARGINITQTNDSQGDTRNISVTTSSNFGTFTGGFPTMMNISASMAPVTTTLTSDTELSLVGVNSTVAQSGITLGTGSNLLFNYAGTFTQTVSPIFNSASGADLVNSYGVYGGLSGSPTLTSVTAASSMNSYSGYFTNSASSAGDANLTYTSYGIRANATGNLTTTGTTAHYGGHFTASGTADTNYGLYVTSSGATDNNYALYSAAGTNTFLDKSGFGADASASDYLINIEGNNTLDYSRLINITQANDSAENSTVFNISNTFSPGTLNATTRTNKNIDLTMAPLSNITNNSTYNLYGIDQTLTLDTIQRNSDTAANTINVYGNNVSITGSSTINEIDGGNTYAINTYGYRANLTNIINSDSSSAVVTTYGGYFNNETEPLTISASPTLTNYGIYASALANLGTAGTTTHYGGHFTASGTADTNYGLYVTSSGATDNNYALYSAAGTNTFLDKSGFGADASTSDYLINIEGNNTLDYSRLLNITQANDANENSSVFNITNTANVGTLTSGVRSIYNLDSSLTPTATLSTATTIPNFEVIGAKQTISLDNLVMGDTGSSSDTVANIYGNNVTISGTPEFNDGAANDTNTINAYGHYASVALQPTLTVPAGARLNSYGGYFSANSISTGSSGMQSRSYGIFAQSTGDLTTDGTTIHYGIHSLTSGIADTNYGLYTTSTGATTNYGGYFQAHGSATVNYGIYLSATDATTNHALYVAAGNATFADGTLLDLSAINMSANTEGLILPQNASACANATAEGQICWDTAGEDLYIGNGTTAIQMNGGGGGVSESGTNASGQLSYFTSDTNITSDSGLTWAAGATNGNGLVVTQNALTTGTGFNLSSSGTITTSGELFSLTANSATTGALARFSATGLTTGTGLELTGGTALTTGGLMSLTGASYTHTTAETGNVFNLSFADTSSNTSGTSITNGLNIASSFTTTGAGVKTINAINVAQPSSASCTTGSCLWNGLSITTPSTGGSTNLNFGVNIQANGQAGGILVGYATSNITSGGAIEVGYAAGMGYDIGYSLGSSVAYTQTAAFTAFNVDASTNITVPNSAAGNQNGFSATMKDGGASATSLGFSVAGTYDYGFIAVGTGTTGIDLSNASLTNDIILDDGLVISQTSDNDLDLVENSLTLNLDFGETTASHITQSSASGLDFAVTGDQGFTFTSSETTGTTTNSAFVIDATAITSGTGLYMTSDSITSGKLAQFATTGNTFSSGTLLDIRTTSTALTGAAGTGSLLNLDWSATGTATGDLFALNIGANASTTGSLFNILDGGSSIFSISETAVTTSLPTNFTSSGDVAIAYDLNFTNPTASYIKSAAPLYMVAGETFNSSNLTLQTYNSGSIVLETSTSGTTLIPNGNVGIGDTTPDRLFDVKGNVCLDLNADEACTDNTAALSDARLKTNVTNYSGGLDAVNRLRPVWFDWNGEYNTGSSHSLGFIAQEVEAIFPDLVVTDTAGYKNLDYSKLTAVLASGIVELNQKVENALLSIGEDGQAVAEIRGEKLTISEDANIAGQVIASNYSFDATNLTRTGSLASLPVNQAGQTTIVDAINTLAQVQNTQADSIASLQDDIASTSADVADARILGEQAIAHAESLDEKVASTSASLSSLQSKIDELMAGFGSEPVSTDSSDVEENLTDPEVMIATDSAEINTILVHSEATVSGTLQAYDGIFQNSVKSLGETFLGTTTIAGDVSFNGTLTISEGNKIDAIDTLFIQSGPLAEAVDFFNGAVKISKAGIMEVTEIVTEQITVKADSSAGQVILPAGEFEIPVFNNLIEEDSIVILTSETPGAPNVAVAEKVPGAGFVAAIGAPYGYDITFNYLIVKQQ